MRLCNRDDHRMIIRLKIDLFLSNAKNDLKTVKLKVQKAAMPFQHADTHWPRQDPPLPHPSLHGEIRRPADKKTRSHSAGIAGSNSTS